MEQRRAHQEMCDVIRAHRAIIFTTANTQALACEIIVSENCFWSEVKLYSCIRIVLELE